MTDYESFFIAGKEEGKTEDSISEKLGSPAFLAKSLLNGQEESLDIRDKRIASPGKRVYAYLIDALIAVIPVFVLGIILLKTIVLSYILFIAYPSPLVGTFTVASYATFETLTSSEISEKTFTIDETISNDVQENTIVSSANEKPSFVVSAFFIAGTGFYLLYSLICTLLLKGQTIGKKIMKIKVKRSDTAAAGNGNIFLRECIGKVLINSVLIIPLVSFFTILLTHEHKALHDMLSGTIVSDI